MGAGCQHNSMWMCHRCAADRDGGIIAELEGRVKTLTAERDAMAAKLAALADAREQARRDYGDVCADCLAAVPG